MSSAWEGGEGGERNPRVRSVRWHRACPRAGASREENLVTTGTWGFWDTSKWSSDGEPPVLFPRHWGPPGSQSLNNCWCVRARCVSLGWLSSEKGPSRPPGTRAEVKGPVAAVPAEIHVPTGNPAGDGLYQPRTSQVAMLRRYTVRGERHLPPFLDARTHTHISRALPFPWESFRVS